jgi:RimJ/RimL family protein N-acetyltransferase
MESSGVRALAPTYPIETERLVLRPIDPITDVDAIHAYRSLPEVCRYVPFEPQSRQEVAERLADPERVRSSIDAPGQALDLAIVLRETGAVVGDVLLMWRDETNAEIGYVVHPDHVGRGIATEAAAPMLRFAFDPVHGLGLHRVTARIDQRNPASAAVLRKLGMRQEAVLVENEWFKGEWSTEVDFAILDREWAAD